jgi:type IV pilus assembly protein PilP
MRPVMLLIAALALPGLVAAQGAATPGSPRSAPAAPAAPSAPAASSPADSYRYNPEGRRDPFVSLIARGSDAKPSARHADGLAGVAVAEISVRGVLESHGGYVAIVQGPDNKTYIARARDRLQDGAIRAITADGLVILQDVTDPLSLVKQKEVRKGLRASDEGK